MKKCDACGSLQESDSDFCDQCSLAFPAKDYPKPPSKPTLAKNFAATDSPDWEKGNSKRLLISFALAGGIFLGLAYISLAIFEADVQTLVKENYAVPLIVLLGFIVLAIWPARKVLPKTSLGFRVLIVCAVGLCLYGIFCFFVFRFP